MHLAILQLKNWQRSLFLDVLVDKSSYLIWNLNSDLKPLSKFAKQLLHVLQSFFLDNLEYHYYSLSSNAFYLTTKIVIWHHWLGTSLSIIKI